VDLKDQFTLIPGATYEPAYLPLDESGQLTVLPASASFSSSTPAVISVTSDGRIDALKPGSGGVLVNEGLTDLNQNLSVRVVVPAVNVPSEIEVGDTFVVTLVDPAGGKLVTDGAGTQWSISDPSVVAFANQGGDAGAILRALNPGTVKITATYISGDTSSAIIVVPASPSFVTTELTDYYATPCTTATREHGYGAQNYFSTETNCQLGFKINFKCQGGCLDSSGQPRIKVNPQKATVQEVQSCRANQPYEVSRGAQPINVDPATGMLWAYSVIAGVGTVTGSINPDICSISYQITNDEYVITDLVGNELQRITLNYSLTVH
jgi:hypothetical protein